MRQCVGLAKIRELARSGQARQIRLNADLSLREMAGDLDTDPSSLSRWETGRTKPSPEVALRWLDLLLRIQALEQGAVRAS